MKKNRKEEKAMNKNIIIIIETIIILILLFVLIISKSDIGTNIGNNKLIGTYYYEKENRTIRIEENNKCMFQKEDQECTYKVDNEVINLHITWYMVEAQGDLTLIEHYNSLEQCNEALKTKDAYKTAINPKCKEQNISTFNYEARIVDEGILLNNTWLYKKIS